MFEILMGISLPIILLIAAGFVFQKIFHADLRTLSKLIVYLFIPVIMFVKMYKLDISGEFFLQVGLYIVLLEIGLYLAAFLTSLALRYNKSTRNVFANSLVMYNAGNYGIPLIQLVFPANPIAFASQILHVAGQNITASTFGVFTASAGKSSRRHALFSMLKMPALYALALIIIINACKIEIPGTIMVPLNYLADGYVAISLITLGAQLAEIKLGFRLGQVLVVSAAKTIFTPLLGFGLVTLLGIDGVLAAALIVGVSTPTAVNSSILAQEFGNEPEFAAQIVFATTILCSLTLPFLIYFVRIYYGA